MDEEACHEVEDTVMLDIEEELKEMLGLSMVIEKARMEAEENARN